jgi:vacuolar-type H+-ATPase catalytic subunit A/Vma1
LTDDGLVMKSFLCPESTLFDQTILKCNWWFYSDCKSSKSLYDSNLPVSKSYQLMKSISYFNKNYKNSANATAEFASKIDNQNQRKIEVSPFSNHKMDSNEEKVEISPFSNHKMDSNEGKVSIITAKDPQ